MNFAPSQVNIVPRTPPHFATRPNTAPHAFATRILLIYLFLVVSRGVEMLPGLLGVNLRLVLVLTFVSLVAAILAGSLLEAVQTPVVLMFTAFTGWFLLSISVKSMARRERDDIEGLMDPVLCLRAPYPKPDFEPRSVPQGVVAVLAFSLIPILLATVLLQSRAGGAEITGPFRHIRKSQRSSVFLAAADSIRSFCDPERVAAELEVNCVWLVNPIYVVQNA